MIKSFFKYFSFVLVGMMAFVQPLFASGQSGQIINVIVQGDGLIYFYLSGPLTGSRPTCAGANTFYTIKNENSTFGKQQYALLLTAKASGRTVSVAGSGTCTRWPTAEDALNIAM